MNAEYREFLHELRPLLAEAVAAKWPYIGREGYAAAAKRCEGYAAAAKRCEDLDEDGLKPGAPAEVYRRTPPDHRFDVLRMTPYGVSIGLRASRSGSRTV